MSGICLDTTGAPEELEPWLAAMTDSAEGAFRLCYRDGQLTLDSGDADLGSLTVDFARGASGFRTARGRVRNERLIRACTIRSGEDVRVIDATAGLGADAWLLAAAGARVLAVEREPVTAALLADGLRRARASARDVAARIELLCADSVQRLADLARPGDVVYLDPMYPPRQKSALGNRRLRLLARLCEQGGAPADDVAGLLGSALASGARRVVLKRPQRSRLPAALREPGHSLQGRSTRFDVWTLP